MTNADQLIADIETLVHEAQKQIYVATNPRQAIAIGDKYKHAVWKAYNHHATELDTEERYGEWMKTAKEYAVHEFNRAKDYIGGMVGVRIRELNR